MPKRSSKQARLADLKTSTFSIVQAANKGPAIDQPAVPEEAPKGQPPNAGKNPAAVALGRLGGLKGGKARAAKLSKKRRIEIARKAAEARWNKKRNG